MGTDVRPGLRSLGLDVRVISGAQNVAAAVAAALDGIVNGELTPQQARRALLATCGAEAAVAALGDELRAIGRRAAVVEAQLAEVRS